MLSSSQRYSHESSSVVEIKTTSKGLVTSKAASRKHLCTINRKSTRHDPIKQRTWMIDSDKYLLAGCWKKGQPDIFNRTRKLNPAYITRTKWMHTKTSITRKQTTQSSKIIPWGECHCTALTPPQIQSNHLPSKTMPVYNSLKRAARTNPWRSTIID